MKTVTRDGWSVSTETSSVYQGARLNVFKFYGPNDRKVRYAEADGLMFKTSAAAFAYALEKGYLEPFVTPWCRHCRQLHTFLNRKSGFCPTLHVFTSAAGLYDPKTGTVDTTKTAPYYDWHTRRQFAA